jgi:hypothetical protein
MKRSCRDCKALEAKSLPGTGNNEHYCILKHKIECTQTISFIEVEWKPLEECEKPLTKKELIRLIKGKNIYHYLFNLNFHERS